MRFNNKLSKHFNSIFFEDNLESLSESKQYKHRLLKKNFENEEHAFYHMSGVYTLILSGQYDDPRYMRMRVDHNPVLLKPNFERDYTNNGIICRFTNIPRRKHWTPQEIRDKEIAAQKIRDNRRVRAKMFQDDKKQLDRLKQLIELDIDKSIMVDFDDILF